MNDNVAFIDCDRIAFIDTDRIAVMDDDSWIRTCPGCEQEFRRKPGKRGQRFCSKSCSTRFHAANQPGARTGAANPNWRGGNTSHPLYEVYLQLVARCHNPAHPRYADYGARGITVCDEWRSDFHAFVAAVGERPEGVGPSGRSLWSIDRIDNSGGYEPGNVRWATYSDQAHNKRAYGYEGRERDALGRFA